MPPASRAAPSDWKRKRAANKKRRGNDPAASTSDMRLCCCAAWSHKQLGRYFPNLADLVNHLYGQRAPPIQDFRCARARAEQIGEFGLRMPEFFDRIVQ